MAFCLFPLKTNQTLNKNKLPSWRVNAREEVPASSVTWSADVARRGLSQRMGGGSNLPRSLSSWTLTTILAGLFKGNPQSLPLVTKVAPVVVVSQ